MRVLFPAIELVVVLLGYRPLAAQDPMPRDTLFGHTESVTIRFFSPDSKMLATGSPAKDLMPNPLGSTRLTR